MQRYHVTDYHITVIVDDYHQPLFELDDPCTAICNRDDHVYVITFDEYKRFSRALDKLDELRIM